MNLKTRLLKFKTLYFLVGLYFHIPILSFYLIQNGIELAHILLAQVFYALGVILFEVPLGIFGDKHGHHKAVQIAFLLDTLCLFGLIFFPNLSYLYISYFIRGIAGAANSGSIETLIYNVEPKNFTKNLSQCLSLAETGTIISFFIAGLLLHLFDAKSYHMLLMLTTLAQGINLLISLKLKPSTHTSNKTKVINYKTIFQNSKQNIQSNPILKKTLLIILCSLPVSHLLEISYPIQMELADVPNFFIGSAISLSLILYILLMQHIPKLESYKLSKLTIIKNIIFASLIFLFASTNNPILSLISFVILFSIEDILSPIYKNKINQISTDENRATTMSIFSFYEYIGKIIIRLSIGTIVMYSNNQTGLVSIGLYGILGASLIYLSLLKKTRKTTAKELT